MRKAVLAVLLLLMLAGCSSRTEHTAPRKHNNQGTAKVLTGDMLAVQFVDFPTSAKVGEKKYFRIVLKAKTDLSNAEFSLNLPKVESNCNGKKFLGELSKGKQIDFGCYVKPLENGTLSGIWETKYKIRESGPSVTITVLDTGETGTGGEVKGSFSGVSGYFKVDHEKAVEGTNFKFNLKVDDPNLIRDSSCWCSVESAEIKVPTGFKITGLDGWVKVPCGDQTCYRKSNLESIDEEFYGTIGVTKTTQFQVTATLKNIWKGSSKDIQLEVRNASS